MSCKVLYCTGESSAYDLAVLELGTPVQGYIHHWEITDPQQGEPVYLLKKMLSALIELKM